MSGIPQIIQCVKGSIKEGDKILFSSTLEKSQLGEVIHSDEEGVLVSLYLLMDSVMLKRYSIPPLSPENFPLSYYDGIPEVYKTSDEIYVERSRILDLAFIMPIAEVESGMFYLSGAENVYCTRYSLVNSFIQLSSSSFYFSRYIMEPLSVRMFTTLNTLSQNLRRLLYHQAESALSKRSFRLALFPMESFWYLVYRVGRVGIGISTVRSQSVTKYFNTLRMEYCQKSNTVSYLRILTQSAMKAIRKVLGLGIGVGLAKKRPTKSMPLGVCTIGGIMTSIDCPEEIPFDVMLKPDRFCSADGIDFIYSEQNRYLTCAVRFSKVTVNSAEDAKNRIAMADVSYSPESGVYVSVWFKYNNALLEVINIDGDNVTCSFVQELHDDIQLPLNLVAELVAQFGSN
jgi:hypothetical protein